jgi:hypothetical protein
MNDIPIIVITRTQARLLIDLIPEEMEELMVALDIAQAEAGDDAAAQLIIRIEGEPL